MRIDITVKTFEVALNGHPFADDMALSSPTPVKIRGRYRSRLVRQSYVRRQRSSAPIGR
jgi:hypothetical protein